MRCPRCGKETVFSGNPYRPFCSERCKRIDLGKWSAEDYRVPSEDKPSEEEPEATEDVETEDGV